MYSSECWVMNQKQNTLLTAAEMVYLRSVKGCTRRGCSPSKNIAQGLKDTLITANAKKYRKQLREYLLRMDGSRISKIAFEYNPKVEDM
jgi:hypothetical protein